MSLPPLHQLSLASASEALAQGLVTSLELTTHCLKRIQTHDGEIGAFLSIDEQGAIEAARASDNRRQKGEVLSALDGIPVAIKDMILMKGLPNTAGSRILEGYMPPYDATVTQKLKNAGAVILGKLNQDEFAMGSSNESSAYKSCKNPWNKAHTPGGSSGGSAAAIAAGFCYGTLGTDTGGSIRQPAACCGITGIKPTYGRVSRYGVVAYASSLDQVGPMAVDAKSTAMMLEAIAGFDTKDSTSIDCPIDAYTNLSDDDLTGVTIGVPQEYFTEGLNPQVAAVVQNAMQLLKQKGATLVDVSLPMTPYAVATYYVIATAEAASNLARYDGIRYGPRKGADKGLNSLYEETRGELFGEEVKRRIMLGNYVLSAGYYDAYYVRAQKVRRLFAQDFEKAFTKCDMLIGPTMPSPAFRLGEKAQDPLAMYLNDIYTISVNLAGLPGISFNGGFADNGLPIGVQLIGRPFSEHALLNTVHVLQKSVGVPTLPTL